MTPQRTSPGRPLDIAEQFVRVRTSTIAGAYREGGMCLYWAVLLMLHAYTGDGGGPWVSCPTDRISESLGVTTEQVYGAVKHLKRKGFLTTRERGHNGKTAIYDLLLVAGNPEYPATSVAGNPEFPATEVAGNPESPATFESNGIGQSGQSRLDPRITSYSPIAGNPEFPPKRTFKEGSLVEPSCRGETTTPRIQRPHRPAGIAPRELRPIWEVADEELG